MSRQRLTKKERDAVITALGFVLAGEDPWQDEIEDGQEGPSPTWKAVQSAYQKL